MLDEIMYANTLVYTNNNIITFVNNKNGCGAWRFFPDSRMRITAWYFNNRMGSIRFLFRDYIGFQIVYRKKNNDCYYYSETSSAETSRDIIIILFHRD